ncbi:1-acyl-sn-glycerol-3-phosphate acyltransferase [Streptomyces sulfonofaciens]|uniref:1-acyl-sn-glycerol-3-phosphate acyltransferase n=1 Tax=Streptomyces sulfonofaciens TaxID=68272 RepID=A0A919FS85_9ACTN|nr:lysophospholipid acyltransferase family protein [Streptomyces sulfonofaciens]GHH71525.1 1-acyl-sn-glycerol-3-phosphate acyltransferase [Streptomyces sulfonofaciens]
MSTWQPTSTCTPAACIPGAAGRAAAAGVPRALLRLAALAAVLGTGIVLSPAVLRCPRGPRERLVRLWCRTLVRAIGVRTRVSGEIAATGGVLVVANHISWLDVPLLAALRPARMLAKSQVRGWPVAGALAATGRTLFIDRTRPRALPRAVREIAGALRAGSAVAAFPEGSTWCGRDRGAVRRAVFQAALDAAVPVQPVRLRYADAHGARSTAAAFIGADTLLESVWRIARARGLVAHVRVRTALAPAGHPDRRSLARAAQDALGDTAPAGAEPDGTVPGCPEPGCPEPAGAGRGSRAAHPAGRAGAVPRGMSSAIPASRV